MNRSQAFEALVRSTDKKTNTLTAVVSTRQVDSHGSIILPSAFEASMETYMKNPVILWSHDPRQPPIGKCVAYRISDEGMEFDIEFAVKESPFAAQLWALYEGGYLKGFSVGGYMRGMVGNWHSDEKKATLPQYALDALKAGQCDYVITLMDLREVSGCSLPSNQGALKKAVEDGVITKLLARSLEDPQEARLTLLEGRIAALEALQKSEEPEAPSAPEEPAGPPETVSESISDETLSLIALALILTH